MYRVLTIAGGRPSLEERKEGWKAAHARNKLVADKQYLFESDALTFYEGHAKEILKKQKRMTALFRMNDGMAAGVLRAAHEVARSVPGDLSVAGFDNITMSNYTDPPLTTVSAAKEYMWKMAVNRIMELLENRDLPQKLLKAPWN